MELTIALAQYPITQHASFASWQKHTAGWVEDAVSRGAQLLVFPEYGSMELVSVFPPETQADLRWQLHALQNLRSRFCETFRSLARRHGVAIVAPSFPVLVNEHAFVNRAYVFGPNGEGWQDKWIMTRFENEEWGISPGERQLVVFETAGVHFGVQVCYDIEFPVGTHALAGAGAQLIVAPSCTEAVRGAARIHIAARARALEQQLYTAVAQTIGEAPWSPAVDVNFGYAAVYSSPDKNLPEDGILARGTAQEPSWLVHRIEPAYNDVIRHDGQVLNYADSQRLAAGEEVPPVIVRVSL
jgi:predicted amidohydrolase